MIESIVNALVSVSLLELLLILLAKTIEVTIMTLRVILIAKGYRKEGTALSFLEILLWTFVASRVIMGLA